MHRDNLRETGEGRCHFVCGGLGDLNAQGKCYWEASLIDIDDCNAAERIAFQQTPKPGSSLSFGNADGFGQVSIRNSPVLFREFYDLRVNIV